LVAIQSGEGFAAELAIRTRRRRSEAGEVSAALRDGRLIKTFAFRGATHLMTPEDAGIYLALRASARVWELPSWRSYYRVEPQDWPALRSVAREALDAGPLTVNEVIAALAASRTFSHLGEILPGNPWGVMKVLGWHGDLSFGPMRGRQPTLQKLDGNPRWTGLPDVEEAGPHAIEAYLGAYGPATPAHLRYWLGSGLGAGKRINAWLDGLGDRLASIEVEGTPMLLSSANVRDIGAATASDAVRLLAAYDPWVLGPGTADPNIVPPARRSLASRGANLVVAGGVVSGAWSLQDESVAIEWFAELGAPPAPSIDAEVERLGTILDRPLSASLETS
jgi:DNA glycosylase AlkZ-like